MKRGRRLFVCRQCASEKRAVWTRIVAVEAVTWTGPCWDFSLSVSKLLLLIFERQPAEAQAGPLRMSQSMASSPLLCSCSAWLDAKRLASSLLT